MTSRVVVTTTWRNLPALKDGEEAVQRTVIGGPDGVEGVSYEITDATGAVFAIVIEVEG